MFTIEVSEAEYQIIALAIGRMPERKGAKTSRRSAASTPLEALVSQGDPELDAFIAAHHRPDWRAHLAKALQKTRPAMMTMPAAAPGWKRSPITQAERASLFDAFNVRETKAAP